MVVVGLHVMGYSSPTPHSCFPLALASGVFPLVEFSFSMLLLWWRWRAGVVVLDAESRDGLSYMGCDERCTKGLSHPTGTEKRNLSVVIVWHCRAL